MLRAHLTRFATLVGLSAFVLVQACGPTSPHKSASVAPKQSGQNSQNRQNGVRVIIPTESPDQRAWELAALAAYKGSSDALNELQRRADSGDAAAEYGLGQYYLFIGQNEANAEGKMRLETPLIDIERDRLIDLKFPEQRDDWTQVRQTQLSNEVKNSAENWRQTISWWDLSASHGDQYAAGGLATEYFAELFRTMAMYMRGGLTPGMSAPNVDALELQTYSNACVAMSNYFATAIAEPNPNPEAMGAAGLWSRIPRMKIGVACTSKSIQT